MSILVLIALTGCAPKPGDDTAETGAPDTADTSDTSDTSESGDTSDTSSQPPAFDATYALFGYRCTSCHNYGVRAGDLDLSDRDGAYASLVGVTATGSACGTSAHTRVVPGDVGASLLYAKLAGTQDCGQAMPSPPTPGPAGSSMFTPTELQTVADWIAGGALDH